MTKAKEGNPSFAQRRRRLVAEQLADSGVTDPRVRQALLKIPRERFVPRELRSHAYENIPLGIGRQQTISQPLIVGLMSQLAAVTPGQKVLEIGTGSGYQAAVLAELGAEVYSIERIQELATRSRSLLRELGYGNIRFRHGDGHLGWSEAAPFDVILLTAAPEKVPETLLHQLKDGGRLIAPVGGGDAQELEVWTRRGDDFSHVSHGGVRFVPMRPGEA